MGRLAGQKYDMSAAEAFEGDKGAMIAILHGVSLWLWREAEILLWLAGTPDPPWCVEIS
jgi:hypothetical protein